MNTFDDVDNTLLRTYNRCVMATNIRKDEGEKEAETYLKSISPVGQNQMLILFKAIEIRGLESVKREVMQGVQ